MHVKDMTTKFHDSHLRRASEVERYVQREKDIKANAALSIHRGGRERQQSGSKGVSGDSPSVRKGSQSASTHLSFSTQSPRLR